MAELLLAGDAAERVSALAAGATSDEPTDDPEQLQLLYPDGAKRAQVFTTTTGASGRVVTEANDAHLDAARSERGDWRGWARNLSKLRPDLNAPALHVAPYLQLSANAVVKCWPGSETIVSDTRLSPRKATAAITELKDADVIRHKPGTGTGHSPAVYWLVRDLDAGAEVAPGATQGRSGPAPQGGAPRARENGSPREVPW